MLETGQGTMGAPPKMGSRAFVTVSPALLQPVDQPKELVISQKQNACNPTPGISSSFSNMVFPLVKDIPSQGTQAGVSSPFLCSGLTSLVQAGKKSEEPEKARPPEMCADRVCRGDWEVMLDIDEGESVEDSQEAQPPWPQQNGEVFLLPCLPGGQLRRPQSRWHSSGGQSRPVVSIALPFNYFPSKEDIPIAAVGGF